MKNYIIIGNSTAGISAVKALKEYVPASQITVISAEKHLPYSRVLLTHMIAGRVLKEDLFMVDPNFYERMGIKLMAGVRVTGINPDEKSIVLENGKQLWYDALLVSTGGSPVIPETLPVMDSKVTGLRTIEEALKIKQHAVPGDKIAVIGGGPVGVKLACALRENGCHPQMLVSSTQVLSRVADDEAAQIIKKRLTEHGVGVRTGTDIVAWEESKKNEEIKLHLDDGSAFHCTLAVFCKGVRPNTEMFGELLDSDGGIKVDSKMQSVFPNIYAAGDVAITFELSSQKFCVVPIWPHAVQQGRVAGINMAGDEAVYGGSLYRNALEIFGLPFISLGTVDVPADGDWDVETDRSDLNYRKLVYKNDRLVGAQLVGDVYKAGLLQAEIRREAVCLHPCSTQP